MLPYQASKCRNPKYPDAAYYKGTAVKSGEPLGKFSFPQNQKLTQISLADDLFSRRAAESTEVRIASLANCTAPGSVPDGTH